jgi:hypothetical protein
VHCLWSRGTRGNPFTENELTIGRRNRRWNWRSIGWRSQVCRILRRNWSWRLGCCSDCSLRRRSGPCVHRRIRIGGHGHRCIHCRSHRRANRRSQGRPSVLRVARPRESVPHLQPSYKHLSSSVRLSPPPPLLSPVFVLLRSSFPLLLCLPHLFILLSAPSIAGFFYIPSSTFCIIRIIKSRRMRRAEHVARMGEKRNVYRLLVGKPEGKRPVGRPRRR